MSHLAKQIERNIVAEQSEAARRMLTHVFRHSPAAAAWQTYHRLDRKVS